MMRKKEEANIVIFLCFFLIFLAYSSFSLATPGLGPQVSVVSSLGNITSDKTVYSCYPSCTAYINVSVNNDTLNVTQTIFINNSADEAGVNYEIAWWNRSSEGWVSETANNTAITGFNLTYYSEAINEFRINISMPEPLSTKWNFSIWVNNKYHSLDPYLDSINITLPLNSSVLGNDSNDFSFVLYANNNSIQNCSLYINSTSTISSSNISADNGTVTTLSGTLSAGQTYWYISCNATGDSEYKYFSVDTTVPTIHSINLTTNITRTGGTVYITVNTSDSGGSYVNNVTVGGQGLSTDYPTTTPDRLWNGSINVTMTSSGTLSVIATDKVGHSANNDTPTIVIENTYPLLNATFTEADNGSTVDTTGARWYNEIINVNITATAYGDASVDTISYRNGTSEAWTIVEGSTVNLTLEKNIFNNTFQFRANDTAGNIAPYQTKLIKIDTVKPIATVYSLSATTVPTDNTTIVVSANLSDSLSNINASSAIAWHNGSTGSNESSSVSLSLSNGKYIGTLTAPSTAGNDYYIFVNVSDNAGNINNTIGKQFAVNSANPTIVASKANLSYIANQTTISFTITNSSGFQHNYTGADDIASTATMNETYQLNLTLGNSTDSDIAYVHISANNTVGGNIGTNETFAYQFDTVEPTAPLAYTLNESRYLNGTRSIPAYVTDAGSGVANVSFYIGLQNDTQYLNYTDTTPPYTWEINTLKFSDENYTINITAVDNVGLSNKSAYVITINNSKPVTQSVTDGVADFGGTSLENIVPQITGLNSSEATVTVRNEAILSNGTISSSNLSQTVMYLDIDTDTAFNSTVYFRIPTDTITSSNTSNIWVYMDHNEDGDYNDTNEGGVNTIYTGLIGDYYEFYFHTTEFSIFAIGIKAQPAAATDDEEEEEEEDEDDSSGGSGTTTTSNQTADTGITYNRVWGSLQPGNVLVSVTKTEIGIREISFYVSSTITSASLKIMKLDAAPASVAATPPDTVNQYLKIEKTNIGITGVSGISITFRILKSWLSANNIPENSVSMYRYSGGTWAKLTTVKKNEEGSYVYYDTNTPDFSYFAIAGKGSATTTTAAVPTTTTTAAEGEPEITGDAVSNPEDAESETEDKKANYAWIFFAVIFIVGIGGGVFIYKHREDVKDVFKKSSGKEEETTLEKPLIERGEAIETEEAEETKAGETAEINQDNRNPPEKQTTGQIEEGKKGEDWEM